VGSRDGRLARAFHPSHIPDDFDELPEDIQRAFGMIDDE
jgi:hypothetical protein